MGAVEICVDEDGALKVAQRYDLRPLLRRLRPEGFERHRVFAWPTCSVRWPDSCCCRGLADVEEAKFNRLLKVVFVIVLCLGAGSLVCYEKLTRGNWSWVYILFGHFESGPGILFLAMFAAILTAGVLTKNVTKSAAGSAAPPRREEVQTVSALVQQV